MKKQKMRFMTMLVLLIPGAFIQAQVATKSLSLDEAIQAAIQNNKQIAVSKADVAIANSNYKQTEAIWLPQLNVSHTAYSTNNPLNVFGFKLQQGNVQQADFNPTLLNNPNNFSNYNTQLMLQQPILNPDAIYMRKAAKLQTGMYEAMAERTKEAIKMQVIQQYLMLEFAYQYETVTKEGLNTIRAIYKLTNDRYAQGMMQKSDLLNVEVQVKAAELQISQAGSQIETISDELSGLMHSEKGVVYSIKPYELSVMQESSDAVSMNRSDIKAMTVALNSYEMMIKGTKLGLTPKLNGFANYNINDNSIGLNGDKSYIAGLQLSWDIFKGNQVKHKSATQKYEKLKIQEQLYQQLEQGTIEIRKTKRAIEDADYKIKQQFTAVEQADEALRILKNRYEQGLVSTNDILVAQTQLSEQKLKLAQAKLEQKSSINYLTFLTNK